MRVSPRFGRAVARGPRSRGRARLRRRPRQENPVHRHQAEERPPRDHLRGSFGAGRCRRGQLQRRLARRAQGPHRLRASLRAHDVQGVRQRRSRRAPAPHLRQRRVDERHDQQGSDALLRDPARQPARPRALPRGRSHALARHHQGQPRQPAQRRAGGAAARRRQPAVRPHVRSRATSWRSTTSPTSTRSSARWPT